MHADSLKIGTIGGTFFSLAMHQIRLSNIADTIILAAVGAAVSFSVSFLLKCILEKHSEK